MILTCPACGTQYVVKDGAIPEGGRKVRCAACRHSWHQDPDSVEEALELQEPIEPEVPQVPEALVPEADEAELRDYPAPAPGMEVAESIDDAGSEQADQAYGSGDGRVEPEWVTAPAAAPTAFATPDSPDAEPDRVADSDARGDVDDDFSPFADRSPAEARRRSPFIAVLLVIVVVAALAAAFWFLAPPEWKARVGLAEASQTPLQLMLTHRDRQALASGNELLAVSGRVINPTRRAQPVPPIQAELRSSSGKVVYRWTIAPPTQTLAPGASARFNSAEVNVPSGGEELTVSLGAPGA